ncbi:hypothetical protein GGX14DRAFT_394574 [Mycena pura]|uniref:Uncharacterized protein n=1 Tax=Mycena pura TaxID=153505 RepID=A0AAD6UW08_9AGAR|nr:hypothetical protein GGX14DRAFT_405435 [Mycena pura]KAJ7210343.1 hypothetical protein GGX14DRAFT_394574 [Mycena pura]
MNFKIIQLISVFHVVHTTLYMETEQNMALINLQLWPWLGIVFILREIGAGADSSGFYINHVAPFGCSSSSSNAGMIRGAAVAATTAETQDILQPEAMGVQTRAGRVTKPPTRNAKAADPRYSLASG